jgi:hypothetical protein
VEDGRAGDDGVRHARGDRPRAEGIFAGEIGVFDPFITAATMREQ